MKTWSFVVALIVIAAVLCFCRDASHANPDSASDDTEPDYPVAIAASSTSFQSSTDPFIVVHKSDRRIELRSPHAILVTCRIGLGNVPVGSKQREGDGRTPEGHYYVCTKKYNSKYYRSLGLSYPSTPDAQRGLRDNLISPKQSEEIRTAIDDKACPPWNTPLGGAVCIHGNGSNSDWTAGCIALDNADIDALFDRVPIGTDVVILP